MNSYKTQFIDNAIASGALKFGQFRLKSGRISPHFFNAGEFYQGKALATLGQCYAAAIVDSGIEFDVLFGPAYKGIPLASATAVALALHHAVDIPYAFNRKEAKTHGEGGVIVGAPLKGQVAIVDDVITAGTAIRESVQLIAEQGAVPAGVIIGLDRCERGQGALSAVQEVQEEFSLRVISVINLHDVIEWLAAQGDRRHHLDAMLKYRDNYGV